MGSPLYIPKSNESGDAMRRKKTHSPFTHIYDRFRGYTSEDCKCIYCLHYVPRKHNHCCLEQCCIEEERLEAAKFDRQNEAMWRKFLDETIYK